MYRARDRPAMLWISMCILQWGVCPHSCAKSHERPREENRHSRDARVYWWARSHCALDIPLRLHGQKGRKPSRGPTEKEIVEVQNQRCDGPCQLRGLAQRPTVMQECERVAHSFQERCWYLAHVISHQQTTQRITFLSVAFTSKRSIYRPLFH